MGSSALLLAACLEPNPNADAADEFATGEGTIGGTEVGAESGTEASTTEASTTEASTTEASTTDASTTDASTTDTGTSGDPACVDIVDPDECAGTAGCQPVNGSKLKKNGPGSPCLEPAEFLGCIPEQPCDAVISWYCQGNSSYQLSDGCGPDGFDACEGPVDPLDACP